MIPRQVIFFGFVAFVGFLLARSIRRHPSVSHASWLVVAWGVIFASRPVSSWLQSGPSIQTPETYLEGSPADAAIFLALILAGTVVLLARRISIGSLVQANVWLFVFYAFWGISVLWSDYPFVAFKRWFKDFGNVVMILILLTDRNPTEAIRAVIVRCAYLLVPISLLFVRYYPEFGRAYTGYNRDELMYVGVALHKNTLGQLLLVSCIFLVWDLTSKRSDDAPRARLPRFDSFAVLLMSFYLLRIANSATAVICTVLSLTLLLAQRVPLIQRRLRWIEVYAIIVMGTWFVLDSMFNVSEMLVLSVGRDMTLTTRTDAWDFLLTQDFNPIIGAGFKSFWAGERMVKVWVQFPGIIQAHNGYLETYLEGGVLGLIFLAGLMLAGYRRIKTRLVRGDVLAPVQLTCWLIALFYNYTEAAFGQLSLLWLVTLIAVAEGPRLQSAFGSISSVPVSRPLAAFSPNVQRPQVTHGVGRS